MNVMQKFHAAQVVVTVLEEGSKELKKARADGHVSLIEAVEDIYQVSRTAVQEAGLVRPCAFPDYSEGSSEASRRV